MNSWKTTLTGVLVAIVAIGNFVLTYLQTGELGDISPVAAALIAAVGLIYARDNNVTSESAGASTGSRGNSLVSCLLVLMLIPAVALSTGCPTESQLSKAAKSSNQLSGVTVDVIKATRKAYERKAISLETKDKLAKNLNLIAIGGQTFNNAVIEAVRIHGANGKLPLDRYQQLNVLFNDQVIAPFLALSQTIGVLSPDNARYLRVAISTLKAVIIAVSKGFGNSVSKRLEILTQPAIARKEDYA